MIENLAALLGALAASVAVLAHGVVGHRWLIAQLESAEMPVTPLSTRLFGPADVSDVVLTVTWHVVTAVFLGTAAALALTAFGALESRALLRYIAALQAAIVGLGLLIGLGRFGQLIRAPIPITFFASMIDTGVCAWIASDSV